MRIKQIKLKNFRIFKDVSINFPNSNVTVFIGGNGKGKTSFLDAIALLLCELTEYYRLLPIHRDNYNINNKSNKAELSVKCQNFENELNWKLIFSNEGGKLSMSSEKSELEEYKKWIVLNLDSKENEVEEGIPILAYYKCERVFLIEEDLIKNATLISKNLKESFRSIYKDFFAKKISSFLEFLIWFKEEEDKENELIITNKNFSLKNQKLEAVRNAIETFFSLMHSQKYTDLQVVRNIDLQSLSIDKIWQLSVKKGNDLFPLRMLSDGERMLLLLITDITRRLTTINPKIKNPLLGTGIVLIDEIELHLHPKWQRRVIPALKGTFPNIQFIITTHSPQVLSEVQKDEFFILDDGKIFQPATSPLGKDSNSILEEIMDTSIRPLEVQKLIDEFFSFINIGEFEEASKIKQKLIKKLDKMDSVFLKANSLIERKKILKK
jgi:predicted ATP-binding protein involved in virulence